MIGGCLYPSTWLHRIRASAKLLFLFLAASFFLVRDEWWVFAVAVPIALTIYASLGRQALRRLRLFTPLIPFLGTIYLLQWLIAGHEPAAVSVGRLCLMVLLADLVTMTTTMQAMLDALQPLFRPFDRWGANSARLSLAVSLVVRFVPVLFDLWTRRSEAWAARTGRRPRLALIKPIVSGTLQMADLVAEALDARSFDEKERNKRQDAR